MPGPGMESQLCCCGTHGTAAALRSVAAWVCAGVRGCAQPSCVPLPPGGRSGGGMERKEMQCRPGVRTFRCCNIQHVYTTDQDTSRSQTEL